MPGPVAAYLRLCRLPTVFTALADICAGYLLTHRNWTPPEEFGALLVSSAGLYLSGMVLNDIFDRKIDQQERPNRPIPSGAVSLRAAVIFGVVLMLIGLAAAATVGTPSFVIAGFTCAAVLLYDGLLKKMPIGPVSMGTCRFFNLLLGASGGAGDLRDVFAFPQLWLASAMLVYITGVTWFARKEAHYNHFSALLPGLIVVDAGLLMLAAWIIDLPSQWGWIFPPAEFTPPEMMLFLLGAIALTINRRATVALTQPSPRHIQMTVGVMLLSIISLDAMMIYYQRGPDGLRFAIITLALVVPATLLRRWIPMT